MNAAMIEAMVRSCGAACAVTRYDLISAVLPALIAGFILLVAVNAVFDGKGRACYG